MKEANILTRLCHRNIVGLKGMCLDPCHFAIVLEFMTNGNLEDLLLEHRPAHPIVDLLQCRIRMGLDIAQGMKYLHGLISPIIHRDLKTANVLVDSSYCCKVRNVKWTDRQTDRQTDRETNRQIYIYFLNFFFLHLRPGYPNIYICILTCFTIRSVTLDCRRHGAPPAKRLRVYMQGGWHLWHLKDSEEIMSLNK